MPVGSSYEKRSRAFTVFTLASFSVSTSEARLSASRSSTSTSFSEPCHSGAPAMSAAISKTRSMGASISTLRSPVMFPMRRTLPDQRALLSPAQALDPRLLAHRLRAVRALRVPHELDGTAHARVAARRAREVLAQAPLRVCRPAAVERAVGAAEEVHEGG